jgi:GTP cyclohydrolase I
VVLEGFHMCMAMRGVEKQNAWMTTSAMRGIFESSTRTRDEFLVLIRGISSRTR